MVIAILILSGIVTLIIYFRRHGNSRLPQRYTGLESLPVIEFNDKDEYGDELRNEIDEAYKLWYYGKEQYEIYKKVVNYKKALGKFVKVLDGKTIDAMSTGFNRTLSRVIDYEWGTSINMYDHAVKYELQHCDEILNSIKDKAKRIYEIKQGSYYHDKRYIP